jgi:uncharacterized membrane protein YgdD (TMEM256/DUF423 family)
MRDRLTLGLAALAAGAGACGVVAAAAGAHTTPDPLLQTAATFLMLHAAAILAVCALARTMPGDTAGLLIGASVLLAALVLFCGDLAMRALTGARLFPYAAPIGGTGLILGWLVLAVVLLLATFRRAASTAV